MKNSKFGNCDCAPFHPVKVTQEGQGKSSPTSAKVARARKGTPTGDKPDASFVFGNKNAKRSR